LLRLLLPLNGKVQSTLLPAKCHASRNPRNKAPATPRT